MIDGADQQCFWGFTPHSTKCHQCGHIGWLQKSTTDCISSTFYKCSFGYLFFLLSFMCGKTIKTSQCDWLWMHFQLSKDSFKYCFQLNISCNCLFTAWLPLLLSLTGSTLANNWRFTPPTFLVLSPSLSLAARLANITANITTPQHVPGRLNRVFCTLYTIDGWGFILK